MKIVNVLMFLSFILCFIININIVYYVFFFEEMIDMIQIHDKVNGNHYEVRRMYEKKFSSRRISIEEIFQRVIQCLRTHGIFIKVT